MEEHLWRLFEILKRTYDS